MVRLQLDIRGRTRFSARSLFFFPARPRAASKPARAARSSFGELDRIFFFPRQTVERPPGSSRTIRATAPRFTIRATAPRLGEPRRPSEARPAQSLTRVPKIRGRMRKGAINGGKEWVMGGKCYTIVFVVARGCGRGVRKLGKRRFARHPEKKISDPIRRSQVRDGPPRAGAGGDVAELQGWGAGFIVACFFASDRSHFKLL